ncbi:MAG: YncE family protein [Candidatus Binatia bacterium]
MNHFRLFAGALGLAVALGTHVEPAGAFVTFESGQVRPLAKSPDGNRLFVCNTPDNRLEIFDIEAGGLVHVTSVPVGLEPVAVAARTNTEVWVVNHLSDSVSVVDLTDIDAPRVTRSLTVGDEPRDIVFAGPLFDHAFITTAHRGQNVPYDPQFTTAGVGRADVWVFDANNLGASFGGDEETIIQLFGDTPRPLAVSADGSRVYAGVFFSGNQTTVLGEGMVPNVNNGSGVPIMPRPARALPPPDTDVHGDPRPEVGLIVKFNGAQWVDELGTDHSSQVRFNLPDYDVFAIDATQNPPVQVAGTPGRFPHVGTTLFNMAVNPADGKVFVSNLEAFNEVRFEGPGIFADTTVRGHLVESRISIIDPVAETVTTRHLNKHIDYDLNPFDPVPNATNAASLAFPLDMQFSGDGSTLFVTAFGSSKIGMFDTAELEADTFVPGESGTQFTVTGGGPSGLVLDEDNSRLYVLTRFDNSISTVSTATGMETSHVALHNPEPASVVEGRPFLYDASFTSARGDQACASCHIFGDFDALAWDLGNPDDEVVLNPQDFIFQLGNTDFHPMKGPMTTQSLRGMDNHGPMHWRGDRNGGFNEPNAQPNEGAYDEVAAFNQFNPAFVGLIGRSEELAEADMQKFTDFILQVMYPPNPVRALNNSLTPAQGSAQSIYFNRTIDTIQKCNGCHVLNPVGNSSVERPGFFGSDGRSTFENETQHFKVAHLRNMYQKVGMFGNAPEPFLNPGDNAHKGDQVRGFGFLHDGSIDTVFRFFQATVFNPAGGGLPNVGFLNDSERRDMESFMLAFDSNHRSIVGQQATVSSTSGADADVRVDLILQRADQNDCDAIVKGVIGGDERGWYYEGGGQFSSDRASDGLVAEATLLALAATPGQELTFTAVPVGEGERIGIDRDLDGYGDADETDVGSDPANSLSVPCATTEAGVIFRRASLKDARGRLLFKADLMLSTPFAGGVLSVEAADGDGRIFFGGVADTSFTVNNSGSTYKFKAAKGTSGVTRATVKLLKTGLHRIIVKTNAAWIAPGADESIATTNVTLRAVDECFEGPATKVY